VYHKLTSRFLADSIWDRPSAPIRALMSGYSSPVRARRTLAFLQAYIDDSASDVGDKRLFMAGYLSSADRWMQFADAWDKELRAAPSIDYLKMSEAQSLRGQFGGWTDTDRDQKLVKFAHIIEQLRPFSFEVSISRKEYYEQVRPVAPRGIGNPHFVCVFMAVATLARYVAQEGGKAPIDFIFDEQSGVNTNIALFFDYMAKSLPKEARRVINGTPIFRDDKDLLPLQAADMLAWHVRREDESGLGQGSLPMASRLRNELGHLTGAIDRPVLIRWSEEFRRMPQISQLQSKGNWQRFQRNLSGLLSQGYIPPHGTRLRNAVFGARESIGRFLNR